MTRILVLDDDPVTREFLKKVFERRGRHTVHEAGRLATALKQVETGAFGLMLIDGHLPDGTAFDFLQAVVAIPGAADVPKWLITGEKPLDWDAQRWASAGLKGYLVKPFRLEILAEIERSC